MSRQASGLMAWVVQRVTSVYLAVFMTYLLVYFAFTPPADHAALREWVARPLVSLGLLIFVPVALAHAWVGIRDILMDYARALGPRLILLSLFALIFLASGLWAAKAIVLAGLGPDSTS